jgi:hypothetical protein
MATAQPHIRRRGGWFDVGYHFAEKKASFADFFVVLLWKTPIFAVK